MAKGVAGHYLSEAYLGLGVETNDQSCFQKAVSAADAVIKAHPIMTQRFGSRAPQGKQPAGIPDNGVPRVVENGNVFFDLFQIGNLDYSEGNTESLAVVELTTYDNNAVNGGFISPYGWTLGPTYRDIIWNDEKTKENQAAGAGGGPWMNNSDPALFPGGYPAIAGSNSWGIIGATDYSDEYVWRDQYAQDDRNDQLNRRDPVVIDAKSPYYLQVVKKEWLAAPARLSRICAKYGAWDLWGFDLAHCSRMGLPYCMQWGRDWFIARSAETMLLRAEAYLRLGNKAEAAKDINSLRARAAASYMIPEGEIDLNTILDERARELAWEEHRWPTLLRMGGAGKNEIMQKQLENFSLYSYDCKSVTGGQKFPSWTLFPIPYTVMQLNDQVELQQNPGW